MGKQGYSRRQFFRQHSLAGLGILTVGGLGGCAAGKPAQNSKLVTGSGTITGIDLEGIRERYRKALFDRFLPNMESLVIDHELGGFMTNLNIATRKLESTDKRTWYEGRGIWVYSFLYNHFEKNPRYLEIARKSKDFILKALPADDKFFPASFTKEGTPRSAAEGDIYGNLFVAEGLAEYAKASGESQYFDLARKILFKAVERYDRPDYNYVYRAEKRVPGPRILGHWMILVSVATQMLRQRHDPEIQALADRCVDAVMNHHVNANYKIANEAIAHDMTPLQDSIASQYGDVGHACETFAFIMSYAILRKNAGLFKAAADMFKRHVNTSYDAVYGGYFRVLENTDKYTWLLSKSRWIQEEILIGALILIEHTGDPWAIQCFIETDAYLVEKFMHPEYAFVVDSGDRQVKTHSQVRAENYHHPRQLMVCMLAIDRILQRGRRTSGLFS